MTDISELAKTVTARSTTGRTGGRRGRLAERTQAPIVSLPTIKRKIPVYEVLDEDGVELIHNASMEILEEVGIDFRDDDAAAIWVKAGADVDGHRVRIRPRHADGADLDGAGAVHHACAQPRAHG